MYWNTKRSKRNESTAANWLSFGGTANDGTTYGPPSSAKAWGKVGCPLVPRIYRVRFGQQSAPPLLRRALKAPHLTLSDLDSEFLSRFNMADIPPQINDALSTLFYQLPVLSEVAIPSGIPVSWLTKLPLKGRLRNALARYFWPHKLIVREPFRCAELMAIPAVGKNSLHELLCVLESAESKKGQAENRTSQTVEEMTARILGQVQSEHAGNPVASPESIQEQDETEHGEQPPPARLRSRGTLGRVEKSVVPDRHVREQNQPEKDRIQAEDRVLPVKKNVYDKTDGSIFQEAVFESARQAIRAGLLQFDSHEDLPIDINWEREIVCSVSALGDLLREFASWARAETDAQTIGDAFSHVILGAGNVEEWQAIAEFSLNQAGYKPSHPYTILESWANHLPERERHIFDTRIAHLDATTSLQDLGEFFGVTRERVRQLERSLRTKLTEFVGGKEGKLVRWRAKTVRQMIGVASPPVEHIDSATGEIHYAYSTQIENVLSPLPGQTDFREVVLKVAGPYELTSGWLVLKSAVASDPTRRIREMTDEVGYIDQDQATQELNKWGLDASLHEKWLIRDGKIRKLGDRLVRWGGSIGDKLVIALADIGRPATIETLLEYVEEDRAKTSAANALSIDPRAVRIRGKEWALTSWGLPEYSSIAMSIRNVLKSHEHPTSVEDVVTSLTRDLGLRESSIRAYCQAPMFIRESGTIRLRRDDEPYVYDNVSLQNAKGVFAPGPHRVSILFEVDAELLRGSGRPLALAAGFLLGVALNRPFTFNDQDGLSVTLTYPETSISGPSVGSLRPLAEASGARLGDLLTLTLDKSDKSVTAVATDLAQHESGWQLVSRLTGIDADDGLEGLASALHCGKGEVRAMLAKRGDEVVRDALPKRPVSSELDQALASLEAQLQSTGGSLR